MAGNPWADTDGENLAILPRGGIRFLPTRIEVQGVLTPPDSNAFTFTDVRRIEDPDGNDITAAWVTNDLDTGATNPADTWDANSAEYVGAQASPANVGLFAQKSGGNYTGKVAQKVRVPNNAEITRGTGRHYKIFWGLRLNGQTLQDSDGEAFEYFDVDVAGVLVWGQNAITVDQITAGFATSATPDQIAALILQASDDMEAVYAQVGLTIPTPAPKCLVNATIYLTRLLLLEFGQSQGRSVSSVSQGGMSLSFEDIGARKKWLTDMMQKQLDACFFALGIYGRKLPKAFVFRKFDQNAFSREIAWLWRGY